MRGILFFKFSFTTALLWLFMISPVQANHASFTGGEDLSSDLTKLESGVFTGFFSQTATFAPMADFIPTAGATETFTPDVGDFFFDPGGPGGGADGEPGNYPNCGCATQTTLAGVSQIEVIEMDIFANFDYLRIYDGTDISGTLLYGNGAGDPDDGDYGLPAGTVLNAASGNFFFYFYASTVVNRLGWEIEITETDGGGGGGPFPDPYCEVTGNTSVEPITRVVFSNIDNYSDANSTVSHEDFTSIVGNIESGEIYEIGVEGNTAGDWTNRVTVWIDWNQDGVFSETTERYDIPDPLVNSTGEDGQQINMDIEVPEDALPGETRMRVMKKFNSYPNDSCTSGSSFGQTEDYTVNITEGGGGPFPEPYCEVNSFTFVEPITRVIFADIDNSSDVNSEIPHEDFTAIVGNVNAGDTYSFAAEGYTGGNWVNSVRVYIDWNQDGVFDEATEYYYIGEIENSTGTDGIQAVNDIVVPSDALEGETRMRVMKKFLAGDPSPNDGCTTGSSFGQAEDYTINVSGGGSGGGSDCITTAYDTNNGGSPGWGQFFDASVKGEDLSVTHMDINTSATGTTVNLDVYIIEGGTYLGNELNEAAWGSPVSSGSGTAMGENNPTQIILDTPIELNANEDYAFAIFFDASPKYTNGTGSNQHYENDEIELNLGAAVSGFFTGSLFPNRVFNGSLCYDYGGGGGEPEPGDDCEIVCPDDIVVTSPDGEAVVVEYEIEIDCDGADGTPHSVTQNIGDPINNSTGIDCQAGGQASSPGGIMRAYTNDSGADFSISSVEIGGGGYASNTIRINIYTYTGAMGGVELTYDDMTLVGQSALVTPQVGGFMTIDMGTPVVIPDGVNYVVEQWRDAGQAFLFGFDDINGETAPTYIWAYGDCGIDEPATLASIGFGEYSVIQKLNGLLLDEPELVQTSGLPSGSEFPIGTTTNCFELRDADGNVLDECCFDVTVNTEAEGDECEVDYPTEWTDGLGNLQTLIVANDFEVPADTEMTIEKIILPIFADITNGTLEFFDDNGGEPGTSIGGPFTVVPDKELVGNVFDFNTYIMEFALPENVVVGTGIYWVSLSTTAGTEGGANYWAEATSTTNQVAMISTDGGATWETNSFGQDGAFTVEGHCVTLGLGDVSSFDFSYYPNPVRDMLYIKSAKDIENVRVFNLTGQEIISNSKVSNGQIDVNALPAGVYVFRVMLEGGQVETFKIIKK